MVACCLFSQRRYWRQYWRPMRQGCVINLWRIWPQKQSQVDHWRRDSRRCFMVEMTVAPNTGLADVLRFDRVAITCVFGDPRDPRSWSGAPANLANALERL